MATEQTMVYMADLPLIRVVAKALPMPGEQSISFSELISLKARGAMLESGEFVALAKQADPEALKAMRAQYDLDLEKYELATGLRKRPDWSNLSNEDIRPEWWARYSFEEIARRRGVSKQSVAAWFSRNMAG